MDERVILGKMETASEIFTLTRDGLHIWIGRDSDGESWLTADETRKLRDWLVENVHG